MNILGKRSDLPFSRKSNRKKEESTVSFTHVQNIICSQTELDGFAHEQTIICRQLLNNCLQQNLDLAFFHCKFCRSRGGLSTNEKKEKFALNDNM